MSAPFDQQAGNQPAIFKRSWWSTLGVMLIVFLLMAGGLAVWGILASGGERWLLLGIAAFLGLLMWPMGRLFFGRGPYLQIDEQGISGTALAGQPVAWQDVTGVDLLHVQGQGQLQIQLRPGVQRKKTMFSGKGDIVNVPLTGMNPDEHDKVLDAALQRFKRQAPAVAEKMIDARIKEAEFEREFYERLLAHTPTVWSVGLITALCVLVWLANLVAGFDFMSADAVDLYRWGANTASAVQAGQWWRMVTAMFLHGGILHLLLNMYALWQAGVLVARLYGNRGFLLIYFGSGIVGSALSLHYGAFNGVSVGASGAVFGVTGALLMAVIEHRGRFPAAHSKQLITSLAIFIIYSLAYGFSKQGIDNAAHIGGLLAGLAMGWLMEEKIDERKSAARRNAMLAVSGIVALMAAVVLVQAVPAAKRDVGKYLADLKTWSAVQPKIGPVMDALKNDGAATRAGKMTEAQLLERVRKVHLPALRGLESELASLSLPADERAGKFAAAQLRYFRVRADLLEAQLRYAQVPTEENGRVADRLYKETEEAALVLRKMNEGEDKR